MTPKWEHASASQVQTFQLCERKWWFSKIQGLPEDFPTAALQIGTEMHARIEQYLRDGDASKLGTIERAGLHFIPKPGTVEIEAELRDFTIAGVPIVGRIDVLNRTGVWLDDEGAEHPLNPQVVEVIDWKSTSNLDYAKNSAALAKNPQMVLYGKYVLDSDPTLVGMRLSHGSFCTKKRGAIKTSAMMSRAQVDESFIPVRLSVQGMKRVSEQSDMTAVHPNESSCFAFNRPCPFLAKCRKGNSLGLSLLGIGGRNSKLPVISTKQTETPAMPTFLDKLASPPPGPRVNPPDAPAFDPVLASAGLDGQIHVDEKKNVYVFASNKWELAHGKFGRDLLAQYESAAGALPSAPSQPTEPKRGRGRPPKSATAAAPATATTAGDSVTLYLSCVVQGVTAEPLEHIIDQVVANISAEAKEPGVDIRCSSHPALEYGKWKGTLASAMKAQEPAGAYTLFATGEIYQVAGEAFASLCDVVVRGVK